jgi:hypothetical protein
LSGVAAFLLSSVAWANSYSIFLDAKIGAKKSIQGRVKILEGQEGIVSTQDTVIKIVPTNEGHGKTKIQVDAFRKTETGLQPVSHSAVVVRENVPAEISEKTEDGQPLFRIRLSSKTVR